MRPGVARGENTAAVRARVEAARRLQLKRADTVNARLDAEGLAEYCALPTELWQCLRKAAERFRLSPRACHRILKVARTIADLDGAKDIRLEALAEAIDLRRPTR
jgi:magnesium chelatase family protein